MTVRCPDPGQRARFRDRLAGDGVVVHDGAAVADRSAPSGSDALTVEGVDPAYVGDAAYAAGVRLHELSRGNASLEEAYHELTADSVEFS